MRRDYAQPVRVATHGSRPGGLISQPSTHRRVLWTAEPASCSTTDATSGVATAASVSFLTSGAHGVGEFTATCAGAVDHAGNVAAPVSVGYSVAYAFGGLFPPVDNPPVVNVTRRGRRSQ